VRPRMRIVCTPVCHVPNATRRVGDLAFGVPYTALRVRNAVCRVVRALHRVRDAERRDAKAILHMANATGHVVDAVFRVPDTTRHVADTVCRVPDPACRTGHAMCGPADAACRVADMARRVRGPVRRVAYMTSRGCNPARASGMLAVRLSGRSTGLRVAFLEGTLATRGGRHMRRNEGDTMIELQGVQRHYAMSGQTVRALAGVDLHIGQGEFVTITGASGSGKSSLLNILGCLDRPSTGTYLFEGRDVATFDDEASSDLRNRRIGFVFQSFHLLPRLTVLENVMLPLRFHRQPPPGTQERALALLLQPALLLADEPTGNLDSKSAADVLALIDEVHAGGQTVVLVTHDNDIAARAPRQVKLHDGKVDFDALQ